MTTRIIMNVSRPNGSGGTYKAGTEYDLPDDLAELWRGQGICRRLSVRSEQTGVVIQATSGNYPGAPALDDQFPLMGSIRSSGGNGNGLVVTLPDGTGMSLTTGNNIAFVGDSRARYGRRNWFKAATTADYKGLPADLLGVDVGVTADTSGNLEYSATRRAYRWTVSGDTAGPWTPITLGRMLVESGSALKSLALTQRSLLTLPSTDQTVSIALAGSMYLRVGWDGFPNGAVTQVVSALRNGPAEYYLGAGGCLTGEALELLAWWNAQVSGPGVDVIRLGTNDISNNIPTATILANATAVFDARRAAGRRLAICGEPARYKIGTTVLDAPQLQSLIAINKSYRAYAEKYPDSCRFVDLYAMSADPNYSDGRPAANWLQDHVHDGPLGATAFGNAIAAAAVALGLRIAPYPMRGDTNLFPAGWMTGTGTTGAGVTGTVPASVTVAQKSGDTAVTATASLVTYSDHNANQLQLAIANADASASRRMDVTIAAGTLGALGVAAGDQVYFEMDCEVTVGSATSIEAFLFIYGGTAVRTNIDFPARVAGMVHGKSIPITIPPGTTNVQPVIYITMPASGSMTVRFGEIVVRKV